MAANGDDGDQKAIVDAIKQFILIIIALGFSSAFGVITKGSKADSVADLCFLPTSAGCHLSTGRSISIFVIYVLVGTRFLVVNWLYLSATYPKHSANYPWLWSDSIGTALTGVLIGVQGYYVALDNAADFFWWFVIILWFDFAFSLIPLAVPFALRSLRKLNLALNSSQRLERAKSPDLLSDALWLANNAFFAVATQCLIGHLGTSETNAPNYIRDVLIGLAFMNCVFSFAITGFSVSRRREA